MGDKTGADARILPNGIRLSPETRLDLFRAAALQGLLAHGGYDSGAASLADSIARAMLSATEKGDADVMPPDVVLLAQLRTEKTELESRVYYSNKEGRLSESYAAQERLAVVRAKLWKLGAA